MIFIGGCFVRNFVNQYIFEMSPLLYHGIGHDILFEQTWIHLIKGYLWLYMVEISSVVPEKKIYM